MKLRLALSATAVIGYVGTAAADTTDSKWQNQVVLAKQGAHCIDDPKCFNRYHPDIPQIARAKPGDIAAKCRAGRQGPLHHRRRQARDRRNRSRYRMTGRFDPATGAGV